MNSFVFKAAMPAVLMLAFLGTSFSAQTIAANSSDAVAQTAARHAKKHADFVEKRINELHAKLKITDKQSPQWEAYAKTMRDNADGTDKAFLDRAQKLSSLNADDAMQSYAKLAQMHAENMQRLATSFSALYGVLSADQKKTADKLFRNEREERSETANKAH
ncbi:Spy/CpxP family protein refolding chaperone [Pseudomonas sp. FEN]|uniref:Spy/CpxP family protein refolding chaperone n=1 Tax=Pseudomonas sp. FEN TaxID=2767468 RepID=UPI00174CCEE2|nr:Spy/CpxP family protein refolding chaperone [Pseudomonas sp. FEN]